MGGGTIAGLVVGYDNVLDIALIRIPEISEGEILAWDQLDSSVDLNAQILPGVELAVIGYSPILAEMGPMICYGRMGILTVDIVARHFIGVVDACALHGMSGGAVVNKWGNLIGVIRGTFKDAPAMDSTFFTHVFSVAIILDDLRAGVKR